MSTCMQIKLDIDKYETYYSGLLSDGTLTLELAHSTLLDLEGTDMDLMQIAGLATATAIFQCGKD